MDTYLVDLIYEHSDYETKCDAWQYIPRYKARTMKLIMRRLDEALEWKTEEGNYDNPNYYQYVGLNITVFIYGRGDRIIIEYYNHHNEQCLYRLKMTYEHRIITCMTRSRKIKDYYVAKKIRLHRFIIKNCD